MKVKKKSNKELQPLNRLLASNSLKLHRRTSNYWLYNNKLLLYKPDKCPVDRCLWPYQAWYLMRSQEWRYLECKYRQRVVWLIWHKRNNYSNWQCNNKQSVELISVVQCFKVQFISV